MPTPKAVVDVHRVEHPPSWRAQPFTVDFILLGNDYCEADLIDIHRWAWQQGLANSRCISPQTLSWSSLFQPRFFEAVHPRPAAASMRMAYPGSDGLMADTGEQTRFWIQSVLFLASVTMSAAIVQDRASDGTIGSKYDKLWQAGLLQAQMPQLAEIGLCDAVTALASRTDRSKVQRLLDLRQLFDQVVERLGASVTAERASIKQIDTSDPRTKRFGFLADLRDSVKGLQAIIVYGSSVLSEKFADYDVVLVVDNETVTLQKLANTCPTWGGKELNVGVYTPRQLWNMQLLSGDNLADYGLCLFGEVELPHKQTPLLLARNLSFGMVRLRQQLGMVGHALKENNSDGNDRRNLYSYFVKIPANIAKGTFGAAGRYWPKEKVQQWLVELCGFDTAYEQQRATERPANALAAAATATEQTLRRLDEDFRILRPSE